MNEPRLAASVGGAFDPITGAPKWCPVLGERCLLHADAKPSGVPFVIEVTVRAAFTGHRFAVELPGGVDARKVHSLLCFLSDLEEKP